MVLTEKYDALEKLFDDNQINSLNDDLKDKDAQKSKLEELEKAHQNTRNNMRRK